MARELSRFVEKCDGFEANLIKVAVLKKYFHFSKRYFTKIIIKNKKNSDAKIFMTEKNTFFKHYRA